MCTRTSRGAEHLRRYFYSGWAFLIPYLTAYLLYYVLKWPVNPVAVEGGVKVASESGMWVPCLLHLYWTLHAINVGLALVAFVAWCREQASRQALSDFNTEGTESAEPVVGPGIPGREDAQKDPKKIVPFSVRFSAFLRRKKSAQHGTGSGTEPRDEAVASPSPLSPLPSVKSSHEAVDQGVPAFSFPLSALGPAQSGTPAAHEGIACEQAPTAFSFQLSAFFRSAARFPPSAFLHSPFSLLLQRLAPWAMLALLFYIPGVYMEFPADPWAHYGRINEWSWLQTVGENKDWAKSSYFLAYSLLGRIAPPTRQLFWLNFYYTGCCLLLCWQYYRLARTVGLGERASLLFVILQSVLFGNNIFGFYRYYGIASTILAQLGAVALVRVAIEYANQKLQFPRPKFQGTGESPPGDSLNLRSESIGSRRADTPTAHGSPLLSPFSLLQAGVSAFSFLISAFASALALLALTAFNHPQGLGIAALGLAAVVIWRLIAWKRSMAMWLAAAALALSVAAVLWWPRNPALDSAYRPGGWLTAWYGFNVFSFQADAGDRTRQIIGLFGLINLAAGLVLLRRNHVVAWLTAVPLVALCFPFVAIPFAGLLAKHRDNWSQIITFHRMLLAIPAGLALICAAEIANRKFQIPRTKFQGSSAGISQEVAEEAEGTSTRERNVSQKGTEGLDLRPAQIHAFSFQPSAFLFLLLTLSALLIVPANRPFYNRFWQALMVPPDDLTMRQVIDATDTMPGGGNIVGSKFGDAVPLTTPGVGYVLGSAGRVCLPDAIRVVRTPPAPMTDAIVERLGRTDPTLLRAQPFWAVDLLYTSCSQSGLLSGHWLPCDVALELSTQEELFRAPVGPPADRRPAQPWLEWTKGPGKTSYSSKEISAPLRPTVEDRGSMNSAKGFPTPVAGDQLVLTPVLRTLDGNGWRVSMNVTGPDSFRRSFEVTRQPQPLGGDSWIYSSFKVRFPKPGQYTIELVGDVVWPVKTYTVRYTLTVSSKAGN